MANVDIRVGKKDAVFFSANPTLILKDGQFLFNSDTLELFIGDGTSQLSALVAINVPPSSGVQSVTGPQVDNTDPLNPVINTPTLQEVTDAGSTTTNNIASNGGFSALDVSDNAVVDVNDAGINVYNQAIDNVLLEVDRVNDTVKILGVDVATTDDLNNKENIVSGIAASGTDTYTATYSPTITSYTSGLKVFIKFTNANTTTATINLNSIGAIAIVKGVSTPLASGDIVAGGTYVLYYDGTNFVLLNSVLTNNKTNYSPTWTGITVPPTPTHAYYIEQDNFFVLRVATSVLTGSGTIRSMTLPFTVTDTQTFSMQVYANGSYVNGSCRITGGTNELVFYQGIIGTAFVNAQSFGVNVSLTFTK